MPNLAFTPAQTQRVKDATDSFNARTPTGQGLTPKQWLYRVAIREAVITELNTSFADTQRNEFLLQVETDLRGEA